MEKLYLPEPDQNNGIIEQFEGYYRLEDLKLEDALARKKLPNEYLGAGQGVAAHTQIIKQADVVMMLHRFGSEYSSSTKRANWEFYEPRTEHGSSLSACAYAMVATECDKTDAAYPYFLKTACVDLDANYDPISAPVILASTPGSWHDGLEVDVCGNIYVAEYNNRAMYRISPGGIVSTYFAPSDTSLYGHGVVFGTGEGPFDEMSMYIPQPYNGDTVSVIETGVPYRTYTGPVINQP